MQDMKIPFSQWIRGERLARGMTLESVASKIGSHKGYVSGIENEKVNPPSSKICAKIGKLFKFHPAYVIWMSCRDKAPAVVQTRIELLEQLRQATHNYMNLQLSECPLNQRPAEVKEELTALSKIIVAGLEQLDHMFDQPKNGNGNGHAVPLAAKA